MYKIALVAILATFLISSQKAYSISDQELEAPVGYKIVYTGDPTATEMVGRVNANAEEPQVDRDGKFVSWTPDCYGAVGFCWEIKDGGKKISINWNHGLVPPSGENSTRYPAIDLIPDPNYIAPN